MTHLKKSHVKETDVGCSPRAVHRKIMKVIGKGKIAVVTDNTFGNPDSYVTSSFTPCKKFIKEYGKMHAVFGRKALNGFRLQSIVYAEALAEEHADLLITKEGYSVSIVTSVYGLNNDFEETYTRNELDNRGHHYVAN